MIAALKQQAPPEVLKPGDTGDDMVMPPDPGYMNPPTDRFVSGHGAVPPAVAQMVQLLKTDQGAPVGYNSLPPEQQQQWSHDWREIQGINGRDPDAIMSQHPEMQGILGNFKNPDGTPSAVGDDVLMMRRKPSLEVPTS